METKTRSMIIVFVPLLLCALPLETFQPPTATAMSTQQRRNNATDWSSLLLLISDDPLGSLASWNDSLHFCHWRGVTCGRRHPERVTALELDSRPGWSPITFPCQPHLPPENQPFKQPVQGTHPGKVWSLAPAPISQSEPQLPRRSDSIRSGPVLPAQSPQRDNALQAYLIGAGSFGSVYKGIITDHGNEQIVAVKVFNPQPFGASRSFMGECRALRNIRHRNLFKIFTSCSNIDHRGNDFKALVLEFMPNGSLEEWLHPNAREDHQSRSLSLIQRLNIAIDVASALEYLHHLGPTPIVHCDLKPSNVLLDNDLAAHVGDFGLARFLVQTHGESSQSSISTMGIKGTIGYVPPGYGMGNQASTAGDV